MKYSTHVKADSLYNTPPTFAIYMLSLVLEWLKENGGVEAAEQRNEQKRRFSTAVLMKATDSIKDMPERTAAHA